VSVAEICGRAKGSGRAVRAVDGRAVLRWLIFGGEHETLYHGRQ
jgi:hypothetical protein